MFRLFLRGPLAPIHEDFRKSGMTGQELDTLLEGELTEVRKERGAAKDRVRSRQCQGFPRNPGRFHPGSGLSPSLDQLGAIEREASFL